MDWSFLLNEALKFAFILFQNVVNHYLLLQIQFLLMDIKIPKKKLLYCSILVSLLYFGPSQIAALLLEIFHMNTVFISVWIYSSVMVVNPLSAVGDYFSIKNILAVSPTRSNIILRNLLLMHYIVVLVYWVMNTALATFVPLYEVWPFFYLHEVISIFLIIFILLICYWIVKVYITRTKKHIVIPPEYNEQNWQRSLLQTLGNVFVFYVTIVFFRGQFLLNNLMPGTLTTIFIYILLIGLVFAFLALSISGLNAKVKEWEIKATGTYISSLLHANQEFRGIKHDFMNVLQAYSGYLEIDEYEGLKEYHAALFHTTKLAGDFLSLIEVLKTRITIYSLIKAKAEAAEKIGLTFSINMMCDISDVILKDLDLCRILSIVMDNAIEAAGLSAEKQINLSFEKKDKNTIIFAISNTTSEDVPIERIFDNGYTTKESHTGIGLSQVVHILHSYEHCKAHVNYHDGQFTIFLILYNNPKQLQNRI